MYCDLCVYKKTFFSLSVPRRFGNFILRAALLMHDELTISQRISIMTGSEVFDKKTVFM
jgi:hypothetical protein